MRCGLHGTLAGHLTGRAERTGRRHRMGTGQRRAHRRRVPENTGTDNMVMQFQHKENVQLYQNSKPRGHQARAMAAAKHRGHPERAVAHNSTPAERRRLSPPGYTGSGSQKSPAATEKSARPQSQWQTAAACQNRFRAKGLPAAVPGRPPALSS